MLARTTLEAHTHTHTYNMCISGIVYIEIHRQHRRPLQRQHHQLPRSVCVKVSVVIWDFTAIRRHCVERIPTPIRRAALSLNGKCVNRFYLTAPGIRFGFCACFSVDTRIWRTHTFEFNGKCGKSRKLGRKRGLPKSRLVGSYNKIMLVIKTNKNKSQFYESSWTHESFSDKTIL